MRRTVGFTASLLALLLLAFSISARAEILTASVLLSPAAEITPPVPVPTNASGGFVVTINITRDGSGNITAATMNFLGTVSFQGAVTVVGLHIHEQVITANGPVRFDTGLSGANTMVFASGSGLINLNVATVDLAVLGRLLANPTGFYVNLHTSVNGAGAIRGQIVRLTETSALTVPMTTAQEVNPPVPLPANASGTGTITVNPVRRPTTGEVIGGSVTFTVQHEIPANLNIVGLHIHEQVAGQNGGIVIDTRITAANSVPTATGRGTISLEAAIITAAQLGALQRLIANPAGFYVNLHTSANPAGVIRGQLTSFARPPVIQQSNTYFLETGSTDAPIGLLVTGIDLASTVLVNGQVVTASLDVNTGGLAVVIPAAARANAGTLFVQARNGQGVMSAPLAIVVAPTASVNTTAIATTDAARYGGRTAPEAIAAGFGARLSAATVSAAGQPLPFSLDGTSVYVNGVGARLFFVSPNQINYLVPAGTVVGPAAVVAVARDGTVSRGALNVAQSAAAIFTSNSLGTGAPAAVASTDGQVFNILVGNTDGTPREIGAGNFVALFGTGLRYGSAPMTIAIGTTNVTPSFVGAQADFAGLDQVNLQIPQSLAGAGLVN
ncbi:MAG: CHRD domain-containing protein, partial [Blastocatellia bacterium]